MAVSQLYSDIGQLGTQCAQEHYAFTTDRDGVLPWLPTDADRARLVQFLGGRAPTLEETRVFEAGYRESITRLDGNAHDTRINAVLRHEIYHALNKYGIVLPPEGTPQRVDAEKLLTRALAALKDRIDQLGLPPPPETVTEPWQAIPDPPPHEAA